MDILPRYLKESAYNCVQKKNTITFRLKCTCGNETFEITKAKTNHGKQVEERWENYWKRFKFIPIFSFSSATERKSGKQYTYGSTFFGIRVGKFYDEEIDLVKDYAIVKTRCPNCEKEVVIFDSRKHGYDALADALDAQEVGDNSEIGKMDLENESALTFCKFCKDKPSAIIIKLRNDLSCEDFFEIFGNNASEACYSNAFSQITIYSVINGKTRTVFDMETA